MPMTVASPEVGWQQAEQDLDERALARAIGTDQPDDPGLEIEGQARQCDDAARVSAGQVTEGDDGHAPERVPDRPRGGTVTEPRILATEARGAALVDDIRFDGPDGLEVEAYLVRPATVPPNPGMARPGRQSCGIGWIRGTRRDRTQFLDEATELASAGAVCLLPQGRFPWTRPPTGAACGQRARSSPRSPGCGRAWTSSSRDRTWTPARLAVVGHDFGGMLAAVEAADDDRLRALVLVAATPRWGDWFLTFWRSPRTASTTCGRCARSTRSRSSLVPGQLRSCSSTGAATSTSPR